MTMNGSPSVVASTSRTRTTCGDRRSAAARASRSKRATPSCVGSASGMRNLMVAMDASEARRAAGREVDLADVGKMAVGEHVQRPSARRDSQLLGQRTLAQAAVTEANACSHRVACDRDRGDAVAEVAQLLGEPRHPRSQLRRRRFLERLELFERLRIFAQPLQRAALVVEERGILGQAIGLDVRRERIGRAPGVDRVIPALLDLGGTGRGFRRCGFRACGLSARGVSARERRMGAHER